MSVCTEVWGDLGQCPCFQDEFFECNLNVFEGHTWDMTDEEEEAITCPYAPILKLLLEAVEVSNEEKMKTTKHVFGEMAIQDLKAKGWERVEFWIRRKP